MINIELTTINLTDIIALVAFIWMGFNIHSRIDAVNRSWVESNKQWTDLKIESNKQWTEIQSDMKEIKNKLEKI